MRRVNFTGSTTVGRILARVAAKYLKPILLELGGKAPLVVLDDADVDAAVDATVFGAFANAGQICMSTERVIVDETVADEFAGKLARARGRLAVRRSEHGRRRHRLAGRQADGGAHATSWSRMRSRRAPSVLTGGESDGTVMKGIVVDRVTPEMQLFREESFGPQVSITRVKSVDEAVGSRTTPSTDCPPRCSAANLARALDVARRIESGICHVNGPTVHDEAQMPFGGVKGSGYGRFGGKAGDRRVHRAALDHGADRTPPLSFLSRLRPIHVAPGSRPLAAGRPVLRKS